MVARLVLASCRSAFSDATNGLVDTVLVKGYDRKQEDDADARAVRLLINAGYDPLGYYNFLQRLAREQYKQSGGKKTTATKVVADLGDLGLL